MLLSKMNQPYTQANLSLRGWGIVHPADAGSGQIQELGLAGGALAEPANRKDGTKVLHAWATEELSTDDIGQNISNGVIYFRVISD